MHVLVVLGNLRYLKGLIKVSEIKNVKKQAIFATNVIKISTSLWITYLLIKIYLFIKFFYFAIDLLIAISH